MMTDKTTQKLDELSNRFAIVDMDWLLRKTARAMLDKVGVSNVADGAGELLEAMVDDYYTSRAAELTIEPQAMKAAGDMAREMVYKIDRWAR